MKLKKYFLLSVVCLLTGLCAISCGDDDDDDPKVPVDGQSVAGMWKCTDADVISMDLNGLSLPPSVTDLIADQVENSLEGAVIVIDPAKVKFDGNVVIFQESGVKWQITSMTDKEMHVIYDTTSAYQSMTLKMKVEAEYKKISK